MVFLSINDSGDPRAVFRHVSWMVSYVYILDLSGCLLVSMVFFRNVFLMLLQYF